MKKLNLDQFVSRNTQRGASMLFILGMIAVFSLLILLGAIALRSSGGTDISPAKAKTEASMIIEAVSSTRAASGMLVGSADSNYGLFGTAESNGSNIFTLAAERTGTGPKTILPVVAAFTNNIVPTMPKGATDALTLSLTVPLDNGAVWAYTEDDIASKVCDQINLALRGSVDELIDATLGTAPTATATTGVIAYSVPAAFTTAAGTGDGCFKATTGGNGAMVAKIL